MPIAISPLLCYAPTNNINADHTTKEISFANDNLIEGLIHKKILILNALEYIKEGFKENASFFKNNGYYKLVDLLENLLEETNDLITSLYYKENFEKYAEAFSTYISNYILNSECNLPSLLDTDNGLKELREKKLPNILKEKQVLENLKPNFLSSIISKIENFIKIVLNKISYSFSTLKDYYFSLLEKLTNTLLSIKRNMETTQNKPLNSPQNIINPENLPYI